MAYFQALRPARQVVPSRVAGPRLGPAAGGRDQLGVIGQVTSVALDGSAGLIPGLSPLVVPVQGLPHRVGRPTYTAPSGIRQPAVRRR